MHADLFADNSKKFKRNYIEVTAEPPIVPIYVELGQNIPFDSQFLISVQKIYSTVEITIQKI